MMWSLNFWLSDITLWCSGVNEWSVTLSLGLIRAHCKWMKWWLLCSRFWSFWKAVSVILGLTTQQFYCRLLKSFSTTYICRLHFFHGVLCCPQQEQPLKQLLCTAWWSKKSAASRAAAAASGSDLHMITVQCSKRFWCFSWLVYEIYWTEYANSGPNKIAMICLWILLTLMNYSFESCCGIKSSQCFYNVGA